MSEFLDLQYRDDDLARNIENKGRMAHVFTTASSAGPGSIEIPNGIDFNGALFIEKPSFSFGAEVDPDAVRDLLDLGPNDAVEFPQCTAHITDWDVDENGHYNGAWVALTVTYPDSILVTLNVEITWHLGFIGMALKDVDPDG